MADFVKQLRWAIELPKESDEVSASNEALKWEVGLFDESEDERDSEEELKLVVTEETAGDEEKVVETFESKQAKVAAVVNALNMDWDEKSENLKKEQEKRANDFGYRLVKMPYRGSEKGPGWGEGDSFIEKQLRRTRRKYEELRKPLPNFPDEFIRYNWDLIDFDKDFPGVRFSFAKHKLIIIDMETDDYLDISKRVENDKDWCRTGGGNEFQTPWETEEERLQRVRRRRGGTPADGRTPDRQEPKKEEKKPKANEKKKDESRRSAESSSSSRMSWRKNDDGEPRPSSNRSSVKENEPKNNESKVTVLPKIHQGEFKTHRFPTRPMGGQPQSKPLILRGFQNQPRWADNVVRPKPYAWGRSEDSRFQSGNGRPQGRRYNISPKRDSSSHRSSSKRSNGDKSEKQPDETVKRQMTELQRRNEELEKENQRIRREREHSTRQQGNAVQVNPNPVAQQNQQGSTDQADFRAYLQQNPMNRNLQGPFQFGQPNVNYLGVQQTGLPSVQQQQQLFLTEEEREMFMRVEQRSNLMAQLNMGAGQGVQPVQQAQPNVLQPQASSNQNPQTVQVYGGWPMTQAEYDLQIGEYLRLQHGQGR
jgi:hypothetical protein